MTQTRRLPPMPEIGRSESHYARIAQEAQKTGDTHAYEAAKVGQYVTLALQPALPWDEKLKYFRHAIKRHCQPPPLADAEVVAFYNSLRDLVRRHAGREALRIASAEDDMYAARVALGQPRRAIEDEAEEFFRRILGAGEECPEWIFEEDWQQLKLLRDQWI